MKDIIDEITKLTKEWYRLIGPTHHKDRDCHWYIETKWSYGDSPVYTVIHNGYLVTDIQIKCTSYELALNELKNILIEEIESEKETQKELKDIF
jgi:hypothetical protein